jgi:hypothetical protein
MILRNDAAKLKHQLHFCGLASLLLPHQLCFQHYKGDLEVEATEVGQP